MLKKLFLTGILIYLAAFALAYRNCRRVQRLAKGRPELQNLAAYALAIEGGFIVAVIGGTFVIFQYVEMIWHYVALSSVIKHLAETRVKELETAEGVAAAVQPDPGRMVAAAVAMASVGRPVPLSR